MDAVFTKEIIGFRFNTHVLYSAVYFTDKGYSTGNTYFEGNEAFKKLKEFCVKNGYNRITINEGSKSKMITL